MSFLKSLNDRIEGPIGQFLAGSIRTHLRRRDAFSFCQLKIAFSRFFLGHSISRVSVIDKYLKFLSQRDIDNTMREHIFKTMGYNFVPFDHKDDKETLWFDFSNIVLSDFRIQKELWEMFSNEKLMGIEIPSEDDFLFSLISEGPYEFKDVFIKQGDIVIDAGSNFGVFSLFAAKKGANVFSFEPQDSCFEVLNKNINLNQLEDKITPLKLALGDIKGKVSFSSHKDCNDSGATMITDRSRGRSGYSVDCTTMDNLVKDIGVDRVDFIKADIEGAERLMLSGAVNVLKKFKPKLAICSYHLPDDPEILKKIILEANPEYKVEHCPEKIFAW